MTDSMQLKKQNSGMYLPVPTVPKVPTVASHARLDQATFWLTDLKGLPIPVPIHLASPRG